MEGCYYTPEFLAALLVDAALLRLPDRPLRACDPCCGTGSFAVPLIRALALRRGARPFFQGQETVCLAEIDPVAAALASLEVRKVCQSLGVPAGGVRLLVGDALGGPTAARLWHSPHDLIVGNPPFASGERRVPPGFPRDRAAAFLDRALHNLSQGGILIFILPRTIGYIERWRPVRELLWKAGRLEEILEIHRTIEVGMEQVGLLFTRSKPARGHRVRVRALEGAGFVDRHEVPASASRQGLTLGISLDPFSRGLLAAIERRSIPLAKVQPEIRRGLIVQRHLRPFTGEGRRWIGRRQIVHYGFSDGEALDPAVERTLGAAAAWQEGTKLLAQRRVGRKVHPSPHLVTRAALDEAGELRAVDTALVVKIEDPDARLLALLVLNSALGAFYLQRVAFDGNVLTTPDLDRSYLLRLFLPDAQGEERALLIAAARRGDREGAERLLFEHYGLAERVVRRISAERGPLFGLASPPSAESPGRPGSPGSPPTRRRTRPRCCRSAARAEGRSGGGGR